MLYAAEFLVLCQLVLLVYCALSVITTPDSQVRHLPKLVWLALVIFFPLVGGIAWLVTGRPQGPARSLPYKGNQGGSAPSRPPARPSRPAAGNPDDDEEFLRQLRARAEEQRRRGREQEPGA